MPKKSILLTGASGFIGRNLSEKLSGRFDLSAPGSKELNLADSEAVESYFKANSFDTVLHCASIGVIRKSDAKDIIGTNLSMFTNIVKCSKHFGKMIHLGSGAEYDKRLPMVRVREEEFGRSIPVDDYGRCKYKCSKHIEKAENIICLRIFGCYGKYEDYETRFISNAICKSIFGLPITINNCNVVFSYLYVDDLARIVEHFVANDGAYKFYNAVPSETADLLSIAEKVKKITGNPLPISVRNSGMGLEYSGDNSRLLSELQNFRFTPLDEGIKQLSAWYSSNKAQINQGKLAPG